MNQAAGEREKIVVVGGGLEGCLTALMLARINRNKGGTSPYKVVLVESQDELLNGSSLLASRLHLGGEYPLSLPTALDCLKGAIAWKLVMPPNIYTDRQPMKFSISKATEKEGQNAIQSGDSELIKKTLTFEKYKTHYEAIRKKYAEYVSQIDAHKKADVPGWRTAKTEKLLFGSPDDKKFFSVLDSSEYNRYDGNHAGEYSQEIAGGFQTPEPGLNVPLYLSAIEDAIKEEEKNGNIEVCLRHRVEKITKMEKPPGQNGAFEVSISGSNARTFHVSQVVQAAYAHNTAIQVRSGKPPDRQAKAFDRCMMMIDMGEHNQGRDIQPIFRMLGEEGAMLCPYNDRYAITYSTVPAYRGGEKLLTPDDPHIPKNWGIPEYPVEGLWIEEYMKTLKRRFPVLQGATPIGKVHRVTLNFQDELHERRHEPVHEVDPGHIVLNATKATLAPFCALEAVETVRAHSEGRSNPQLDEKHIMNMALSSDYSLADIPLNPLHAREFARTHPPFPPEMIALKVGEKKAWQADEYMRGGYKDSTLRFP